MSFNSVRAFYAHEQNDLNKENIFSYSVTLESKLFALSGNYKVSLIVTHRYSRKPAVIAKGRFQAN